MITTIALAMLTALGILMFSCGAYITRKMMLADAIESIPSDPKKERAKRFIAGLTQVTKGDFDRVYRITKEILVAGLLLWVFGGAGFVIAYWRTF